MKCEDGLRLPFVDLGFKPTSTTIFTTGCLWNFHRYLCIHIDVDPSYSKIQHSTRGHCRSTTLSDQDGRQDPIEADSARRGSAELRLGHGITSGKTKLIAPKPVSC